MKIGKGLPMKKIIMICDTWDKHKILNFTLHASQNCASFCAYQFVFV